VDDVIDRAIAGQSRWSSPLTDAFVKACAEIGIPASGDLNTSTGSMGATKVSICLNRRTVTLMICTDQYVLNIVISHMGRLIKYSDLHLSDGGAILDRIGISDAGRARPAKPDGSSWRTGAEGFARR
jgi:hypothetical protein